MSIPPDFNPISDDDSKKQQSVPPHESSWQGHDVSNVVPKSGLSRFKKAVQDTSTQQRQADPLRRLVKQNSKSKLVKQNSKEKFVKALETLSISSASNTAHPLRPGTKAGATLKQINIFFAEHDSAFLQHGGGCSNAAVAGAYDVHNIEITNEKAKSIATKNLRFTLHMKRELEEHFDIKVLDLTDAQKRKTLSELISDFKAEGYLEKGIIVGFESRDKTGGHNQFIYADEKGELWYSESTTMPFKELNMVHYDTHKSHYWDDSNQKVDLIYVLSRKPHHSDDDDD